MHAICGLCQSLDRSWGAGDVVPNYQAVLVKHVVLWDEKLLRWAMKPGECVTLRGHHNDRIMHQAGVTNVLRDGVRLKLIQVLGNSAIPMLINLGK